MNEFITSFQLKSVYRTNSFLYYLKRFPLIKHILSDDLYANRQIKTFAKCLSFLYEFFTLFIWKLIYLFMIFMLPSLILEINVPKEISFHIFFFLTMTGAVLNTSLLNPTKDKYYAIILMRMDAKKTALSEFLYFQLKNLVGMGIACYLLSYFVPIDKFGWISIPILVVSAKFVMGSILLKKSQHKLYNENEMDAFKVISCALFLIAGLILPFFSIYLSMKVYFILVILIMLMAIYPIVYLFHYDGYYSLYRKLLNPDHIIFDDSQMNQKMNQTYTDKIEYEKIQTSKTGYAYFNDLFVKRHKKILTRTSNRIALGAGAVLIIALCIVVAVEPVKIAVHENLMSYLPFSLFFMYLINRGESITKTMFINCDHAMLHYRFYRQSDAILSMFKQRLKSLVLINLRPAFVIAAGLSVLLIVSGGSEYTLDYVVLPVTILCLSVFFSVHYLVLYYLLQPYNREVEMKNPLYKTITMMTYMICYGFMTEIDSHYFGIWVIALTLIYILLALILAYRLSPKTFKLK